MEKKMLKRIMGLVVLSCLWGVTISRAEVYYEEQGQGSYTVSAKPSSPTLLAPSHGQTQVDPKPNFQLFSTDADGDSLKYKIQIDTVNTFNSAQTFDQTVNGVGWDNGVSPYTSGQIATYTIQTDLDFSTQYFWRAYAIDPGGTNTWSQPSGVYSFTTRPAITLYYKEQGTANYSIMTAPPNTPENPSQEGFGISVDWAGVTYDTTPTFKFTQSDPENEILRYKIQLDVNSNFSSPIVDYTSVYLPQGRVSFTVGQESAGGFYTTGSAGQNLLEETTYYWRVMSEDITGNTSAWLDKDGVIPLNIVIDPTPPAYFVDQAEASYNVSYAPATKFLVLAPEEVLIEGSIDGKASNIIADHLVGIPIEVSIYAVADNFIIDRGYSKTVNLASSDTEAEFTDLVGNQITSAALVNGEAKVKVKFSKPGGHTVTVSESSP